MKKIIKNKQGITLIALVITIIILMILAGVLINITLGQNGIINKTQEAKIKHKKAQYYEEINIEILEEETERQINPKSEAFIVSLDNRIQAKTWVKNTIMCDNDNNQNSNPFQNTILIVETIEGYEIYIEVDNDNNKATIIENSFKKISEPCIISYDANGGEGTTDGPTTVRKGFKITLPANGFTKSEFEFAGWTAGSPNSEPTYLVGSLSGAINEDTTFYAKWSRNVVTIEYDSNGGSGSMASTNVAVGVQSNLGANTFTAPTGYEFDKWTINSDGSDEGYTDSITVTDNSNASITLYAQWKPSTYRITYNLDGGAITGQRTEYTIEDNNFLLPTPTKSGCIFTGWTGSNGTTKQTSVTIEQGSTGDKEFYANWRYPTLTLTVQRNMAKSSTSGECSVRVGSNTYSSNSGTRNGDFKKTIVTLSVPQGTTIIIYRSIWRMVF